MQSSQNPYNVGNYSGTPEPFYIEHFAAKKKLTPTERLTLTPAQINAFDTLSEINKRSKIREYANSGYDTAPLLPFMNNNTTTRSRFTDYSEGVDVEEGFGNYDEGMKVEPMADLASVQMSNEVSPQWSARANQQTQGQGPAGSFNGDSSFQPVSNMGGGGSSFASNEQGAQSCFPRDRLTADDLLPKDAADSKWAQINPSGSGNVSDQNYLTAGYHVGVNTVGQSLRNANLQLRSEIPNPQNAVGPWMISTIEPDLRQNTLEIGSSISY